MLSKHSSRKTLQACLTVMLAVTQLSQTAHAGLFDGFLKKRPQPTQPAKPAPQVIPNSGVAQVGTRGKYKNLQDWGSWRLVSTQWTQEDELGFSEFVRAIGESDCRTIEDCMRMDSNPFHYGNPDSALYKFWSDCADWPFFLRSYYAWKNGLPYIFSESMRALPLSPEQQALVDQGLEKAQTDIRYSPNGNRPNRQIGVPNLTTGSNFFEVQDMVQDQISTSTLRVDPRTDFGDTYTPAIQPGAIRPGTIVYDPSGHTGVVYDVTNDGQVMVFDAYSDKKSVSVRRPYSSDYYKRSKINHGGWFQNFRPVIVEGATFDRRTGTYVGGEMRTLKNFEIADYSIEMFGNTTTADGKSAYLVETENGYKVTTSFQEFLRRRMYLGPYQLDVVDEFKNKMKAVCEDFTARAPTVQEATTKGIAAQPHSDKLPNTIFGGEGVWEVHSTPGGDVRRRSTVQTALTAALELKDAVQSGNRDYVYHGNNLKADFIKIAKDTLRTCSITYTNTAGGQVRLNLEEMLRRIPKMSFDPWHCIELRWGATSPEELRSCPDMQSADDTKRRWYKAQQPLRNQSSRDTSIFTGYTLEELEANQKTLEPKTVPNYNLIEVFEKSL